MLPATLLVLLFSFLTDVRSVTGCECGIENVNTRIINGRRSIPYQLPWVIYFEKLGWFSGMKCTGSIISPTFILTAAHCVPENGYTGDLKVYTFQGCGITSIRRGPGYKVKRVIRHEDYDGTTVVGGNDIALIELSSPIYNAMPICLPKKEISYKDLLVSGWGIENKGLEKVDYNCLNEIELDASSSWSCWLRYRVNRDKVMCAGGETGVCQGDSGGPLMSRTKGLVYQVGITSFTRDDCGIATKSPAGFEKVAPHLDWIRRHSQGACFK